jgi:hypothetical protein
MKNKLATLTLSVFLVFGFVSPSYAGGGTDGVIEVKWTDIKKNQAKKCKKQKIKITANSSIDLSKPMSTVSALVVIYDKKKKEVSSVWPFSDKNDFSTHFQFCTPIGQGPYTVEVEWKVQELFLVKQQGSFVVPYKFKK